MKTALIAGCTGLIGRQVLELLLANTRYDKVKALTRSDLSVSHPKLTVIKVDYNKIEVLKEELKADDVFCCLGTTMAKAKSKEKFNEVDYIYPVKLAKLTADQNATQFLVISALGADKNSSIYYNRVKGELEEAVLKMNFQAIHIFRPSLLLGNREEKRPGEDVAKLFYKIFWFIIPDKYKAIESSKVAQAMIYFARHEWRGTFIHESRELQHIDYNKTLK